jgi:hypothetical protein
MTKLHWYASRVKIVRDGYKMLVQEIEGEIPAGRSKCRRKIRIKIDAIEIGYDYVDWIPPNLSKYP